MAEIIVLEPVLGVAMDRLVAAVDRAEHAMCMFDSILADFEETIARLRPKIDEIERLSKKMDDNPEKGVETISELLERAERIVSESARVAWWNFWRKYACSKKIERLNASLRRTIEIDLQFDQRVAIVRVSGQVEELRRSVVSMVDRRRKSSGGSRRIFRRSRTRVLRAVSCVKRSIQSTQSLFFFWLISFLRVKNWGYQRLSSIW